MGASPGGTLGLPAGLPATGYLEINPGEETGEPGLTGNSALDGASSLSYSPTVRWIAKQLQIHEPKVTLWRDKAKECYRFKDGKQLSDEDERILTSQKRPNVAFNSVQKYIKFVGGVQRMTPQALIYMPRSVEDEKTQMRGEMITKFYEYIMGSVNQGAAERSRAFDDLNIAGMGWTNTWASRSKNPKGDIMYAWADSMQMLWPENSRQNLEGGKWVGRESNMDVEEAINRWPDKAMYLRASAGQGNDDDGIPDFGYANTRRTIDYKVPYIMTPPLNRDSGGGSTGKPGEVKILEFQFWQDEDGFYFFDPLQGDDTWMNTTDFNAYRRKLVKLQKPITDYDRQLHRVYKNTFLLQRRIMLQEPEKLVIDGTFTYNCMTGHWDNQDKIWYGIMRVLMDPQRYANKFLNQVIEIMGAQSKGGYDAEAGAVTGTQRKDIENNSSKAGSVNIWAHGALAEHRMQPKTLPQIPDGSLAVLQFCMKSFDDVSGIASQSFGMAVGGGTPGVTLRRQMLAGLLILAGEFEALTRFRKREGEIVYGFMKVVADNRVVRVGGPFDSEALKMDPELFNDPSLELDILIDEVEHDPTMRQYYADTVTQMMPTLIRTGKFIPELLDYMPLPVQIRQKLKQSITQQAQMQQEMQKQGVSVTGRGKPRSAQDVQAELAEKHSKAALNQAKATHLLGQTRNLDNEKQSRDLRDIFDTLLEAQKFGLEKQKLAHQIGSDTHNNILETMRTAAEMLRPETAG